MPTAAPVNRPGLVNVYRVSETPAGKPVTVPTQTVRRVVSPESTGGAGFNYETGLGAIALSRLLMGDRVEGLEVPVRRVKLQAQHAGHPLDDVVVEGIGPAGETRVIEFQAKRTLSPAPSDDGFTETVSRCCAAVQGEGHDGPILRRQRRFGLATRSTGPLTDLVRVTRAARSHDSVASFLEVVRTTASAGVVQRLDQLRETVAAYLMTDEPAPAPAEADVDELTWRVARALYVWTVDAEDSGASVLAARDRLSDLTQDAEGADRLFHALVSLARHWAPQAATVDLGLLRLSLEERGFALDAAPAQRAAFETLLEASAEALDTNVVSLGGRLVLPRLAVRGVVRDAVVEAPTVLISGPAGVGKSMLARLVADDLSTDGAAVLAINLSNRTGGLPVLQDDLGVQLRDAFHGAPIGALRVLVLDGAEQVLSDAGVLFRAVLRSLPAPTSGAPSWSVVLVARDEAAAAVEGMARERGREVLRVPVGELSDLEVARVLQEFPSLAPLSRNLRAKGLLLRRPYLVELLIRSSEVAALRDDIVGEEDLMDVVTARLVRRDEGALPGQGAPDARSDIYLALADAAIVNALPSPLDGRDASAREGLRSDGVIRNTRLSWRFAHDVLVDYAVATKLLEPGGWERLDEAPSVVSQ